MVGSPFRPRASHSPMKEALVEQAVGSRDAGMKAREVAMFRSASACGVTVTAPGPHLAMEVESSRNYPGQSMQMQSRWRSLVPLAPFTLTTCSGAPNTAPEIRPADQISIVWLASDHPDFYGTEPPKSRPPWRMHAPTRKSPAALT